MLRILGALVSGRDIQFSHRGLEKPLKVAADPEHKEATVAQVLPRVVLAGRPVSKTTGEGRLRARAWISESWSLWWAPVWQKDPADASSQCTTC